jgi:predicted transcriptional regulator
MMVKTIRELAETLGVSSQLIHKYLTAEFMRKYITIKNVSAGVTVLVVNETGEGLLYRKFKGDNVPEVTSLERQKTVNKSLAQQFQTKSINHQLNEFSKIEQIKSFKKEVRQIFNHHQTEIETYQEMLSMNYI